MLHLISDLSLVLLLLMAVISDFRTMRISNRLIVFGLFISLPLRYLQGGMLQVLRVVPNLIFPVIFLFFLYLSGILGAGDIKLLSLIGSYVSFRALWRIILLSFVTGAVISLLHMLVRKQLFPGLRDGFTYLKKLALGKPEKYPDTGVNNRTHFSLAILIAVILARLMAYL